MPNIFRFRQTQLSKHHSCDLGEQRPLVAKRRPTAEPCCHESLRRRGGGGCGYIRKYLKLSFGSKCWTCADMQIAMTDHEHSSCCYYSTRDLSYCFCRCDHCRVMIIAIKIQIHSWKMLIWLLNLWCFVEADVDIRSKEYKEPRHGTTTIIVNVTITHHTSWIKHV
jgi:hypothetical protein